MASVNRMCGWIWRGPGWFRPGHKSLGHTPDRAANSREGMGGLSALDLSVVLRSAYPLPNYRSKSAGEGPPGRRPIRLIGRSLKVCSTSITV
jgi:hypothetical protein